MAKNALLIWCAGSAIACGTAALATTSLWRAPAPALKAEAVIQPDAVAPALAPAPIEAGLDLPLPEAPSDLAGLDPVAASNDTFLLPVTSVSFFSPTAQGASNLFRATIAEPSGPTGPSVAVQPPPRPDFAEVVAGDVASRDPRLAVLPPPRPSFKLARLDAGAKAAISEVQPAQPPPGFSEPAPVWNWGDSFRQPQISGKPEKVIHAGVASWYGPGFHGRKTASGEVFNQNDMTAAHRTLPFGTRVKVVDEKSGRSIVVRINDRGPFSHGRVIDLSKAASQALGMGGLAKVKLVSAN